MKWNVGMKIGTGFALALAILVAIGAVSYRSTAKLTDTAEWVDHTHQVLEKLEALLSGMIDIETGDRGYVITGEESYLEPYTVGKASVSKQLQETRHHRAADCQPRCL